MRFLKLHFTFLIALLICHIASGEQWSRQLTPNVPIINDWVPISTENKKQGKSITFGEDLTPAAQTNFQFFAEPLNNRFNLQQSHPAHPGHISAPTEINSFVHNSPPQFQFLNPQKQRTVQTFGGPISNKPVAEPLVQNSPSNPPFQFMQEVQRSPNVVHYQSQPVQKPNFPQTHSIPTFENLSGQSRVPHFQKIPNTPAFQPLPQSQPPRSHSNDQVQLLYVPFDSLYQQNQQAPQQSIFGNEKQNRFNILNQPVSASLINDFYSQNEVQEFPGSTIGTTTRRPTIAPPTASYKLTTPFETTSKLKPHQPPLSMFVANDKSKGAASETDVLNTLKNSNTIDVMDQVGGNAPKVFIGPSGMPPPNGYSKFDLPYLSSIDGTRNDRKIDQLPFFVAPLSYKTPPGFSKIPLPAPHVGSVVVNQPPNSIESNESKGFTPDAYYTKQPQVISPHNHHHDTSKNTQTVKLTSGFHIGSNGNVQLISNDFTFPTLSPSTTLAPRENNKHKSVHTTPKPTFVQHNSTPLTKVKASIVQEQRHHDYLTHSPSTTQRVPVTRTKYDEFFTSPRSTIRTPSTAAFYELDEHKTVNEEYFKVNKEKPALATYEYVDTTNAKHQQKDFHFKPIPEFNFEPVTTKKPRTKTTTSTSYSTTSTTPPPAPPTTIRESRLTFPSSTPIPTPSFDYTPTVSVIENTDTFRQTHGDIFSDFRSTPRPTSQDHFVDIDELNRHRYNIGDGQNYQIDSSQLYTGDEPKNTEYFFNSEETIPATENPQQYNLPSELPPISAQLPGLINSLMEEKWVQTINNITEDETTTTTTRKPNTRGSRRPSSSTYRTTEAYTDRRPTRGRRPTTYTSRNSVSPTEAYTSRSTPVRNTKIRYNITSDAAEQSRFRTRNRRPVQKKEEENIEYQRDVLNQNYPSSIRPPVASTEKLVESIHIHSEVPIAEHINDYNAPVESVEVIPLGGNIPLSNENHIDNNQYTPENPLYYENTIDTASSTSTSTQRTPIPRNHKYSSSDQETYQIPQHKVVSHRLKGNFNFNRNTDSFYNAKPQDTTETPRHAHEDDEILVTVPTTQTSAPTTSTTTEVPETEAPIPRRTPIPRRRLYTTTTESPTSEAESYGSRSRQTGRKENVVVVKKVRQRVRTTSTTEVPETTRRSVATRNRASYNTNRGSYRERNQANSENTEEIRPRFRIRENTPRFRLDTQESQWSTRINQNSFQPIDEEKSKAFHSQEINDDQEIVTANPDEENDSYLINVTASVVPTKAADAEESSNTISTTEKEREDDLKKAKEDDLDTSIDKLVKDVMEEIEKDAKPEKKATKIEKKNGRRGVWRKVKVRPADALVAEETQNIGKHLYNSVTDNDKVEGEKPSKRVTEEVTTTEKSVEAETTVTTTSLPATEVTKTRMFDDARKAFTEYLSLEDDTDDAVNMEEADDKLEALKELTTTPIQVSTTEESVTATASLPPPTTTTIVEIETSKPRLTQETKKQIKTSTSQRVTGEICFRGRCIQTDEK